MPLGYHFVFGAYGFWLPNDPRGSWSRAVWARPLRPFGPPVRPESARSVAHVSHNGERRLAAKSRLHRPAVRLSGIQGRAVARGIAAGSQRLKISVYAAAIMPDHVHLVAAVHQASPDKLMTAIKQFATRQLTAEGLHPFAAEPDAKGRTPTPWAKYGWTVFLDTDCDMHRAIEYVNENPARAGMRPQRWSFVTPYEG